MRPREHWDGVYGRRRADEVSWYRPHLEQSMRLIDAANVGPDAAIIDVGCGASTLVDDLLLRGYANITVLDISAAALEVAKARLAERAASVHWLAADITQVDLGPNAYDLWHDRAVFHFLRGEDERRLYVACAGRSLKPGGHLVIATFGPEGPDRCSGLDVVRYGADELRAQFGVDFALIEDVTEVHATPSGAHQQFVYCLFRKR